MTSATRRRRARRTKRKKKRRREARARRSLMPEVGLPGQPMARVSRRRRFARVAPKAGWTNAAQRYRRLWP